MGAEATEQLVEIGMPKLSDSMEEATVLAWLKRPGDSVARGEPLVEVETDKATVVYEAEAGGVLEEIVVGEGETAPLGTVIARLRIAGASPAPPARAPVARSRATPVARRLARQLGVPLGSVSGTGPGGRIVGSDVRAAAGDGAAPPQEQGGRGAVEEIAHTPTQRTIAQRMSESRASIPEFTLETEILMDAAAALREGMRAAGADPLPSFNDLVVRAAALALCEFPALNSGHADGKTLRFGRINIGIAVAGDDALIVPTIFDADRLTVIEIAAEARRLAERARTRSLAAGELADGTFTVSNLGMFGVRRFHAVINPPQAAILALGEVAQRPVVAGDGRLIAARTMEVTLSCDHRVVYGAEAARFLQALRGRLEDPTRLVTAGGT